MFATFLYAVLCAFTWYDESVQTNFYWGMRVTLSNGVHSESSCDEQGVMMLDIVELSRLQFALTAMYHFLLCH